MREICRIDTACVLIDGHRAAVHHPRRGIVCINAAIIRRRTDRTACNGDVVVLHGTAARRIAAVHIAELSRLEHDAVGFIRSCTADRTGAARIRDRTAVDLVNRMAARIGHSNAVARHSTRGAFIFSAVCCRDACCEILDLQIVVHRRVICVVGDAAVELCRPVRQGYHRRRCRKVVNDTPVPIAVVVENHRICRGGIVVRAQCHLMRQR